MHITSRRIGEVLCIGDIKVKILEIRGGRTLLGFDAPSDVRIFREEVYNHFNKGEESHDRITRS